MTIIVVAMQEEIQAFKTTSNGIEVLVTGIGKVNAALKLSQYLSTHPVKNILNIGFAGLHGEGALLDAMLLKQSEYHDVDATSFGYEFGQVPGMKKTYMSHQDWYEKVKQCLHLPEMNGYTGDQFVTQIPINQGLYDMEATALFQTASYFNVPMVSIKIVSDIISKQAYKDFNLLEGAHKINQMINQLIEGGCL